MLELLISTKQLRAKIKFSITFALTDNFEIISCRALTCLNKNFSCACHCELDLVYLLRLRKLEDKFLRVEPGADPELFRVGREDILGIKSLIK